MLTHQGLLFGGGAVTPSKFLLYARAHGGSTILPVGGAVQYEPPAGSEYGGPGSIYTTESNVRFTTPVAVYLSLLQSVIYNNTTTTATTTLRSRNNGANGTQSVTVAAGSLVRQTDTVNVDNVALGTTFATSIQVAAGGTGSYTAMGARLVMQPQTDTTKHWACYGARAGGTVAAGATAAWVTVGFNSSDAAGDRARAFALWYCAATIEAIRFVVGGNSLSVATTIQLYINDVAVPGAAVTVGAGATGLFSLAGLGAVALASGDSFNIRTTVPAGTGSISLSQIQMWTSTARSAPVAMQETLHVVGETIDTTATRYIALAGSTQTDEAIESRLSVSHGFTGRSSGMTFRVQTNDGGGATIRYRVGGADGTQVITVPSAGTGIYRDVTNTDTFGPTDECCYSIVRTSALQLTFTHVATVEEYLSG